MDVLILADLMETLKKFFLEYHEIDPAYCFFCTWINMAMWCKIYKSRIRNNFR